MIYVSKLWHLKLSTYTTSNFTQWKEKLFVKIKEKITEHKQGIKSKQTTPVMSDPDVKKHVEELPRKFAFVTIGKVSNSFAFICRKCDISKLLAEFSPNGNRNI